MATITDVDFDRILSDTIDPPAEPVTCSLSHLIRRIEAHVGSDRWTIQKVRRGDWEARTWDGNVGRGHTATDAVAHLLEQLGVVTYTA